MRQPSACLLALGGHLPPAAVALGWLQMPLHMQLRGGLIRIIDRLGKGRHLMLPATCPLIVVPWHAEVQLEPKAEQPGLPCRC